MAALKAYSYCSILLFGFGGSIQNTLSTCTVYADRLFHENVFAGIDRCLDVERTKTRRSCESNKVYAGINNLLVGIISSKHCILGYGNLVFILL